MTKQQLKNFRFRKPKKKQNFWTAPKVLQDISGLEQIYGNGLFFSKKEQSVYHKAYLIKYDKYPDRQAVFKIFRRYDLLFQIISWNRETFLLLLYTEAKQAEEAETIFLELEKRFFQELAACQFHMTSLDAQERLRLFHRFANLQTESSRLNDYFSSDGGWLKEILSWKEFRPSKTDSPFFFIGNKGFALAVLQDFHMKENDKNFFDDLSGIPGFCACTSSFDPVPDRAVAMQIQSLYLDLDNLFFKMERRQPELCRILNPKNPENQDSRHFTSTGMLFLFEFPESFEENPYFFSMAALEKKYDLRFLYLTRENLQKEAICLLAGIGTADFWFGRMAPSACCGEFLPFPDQERGDKT